ncbi:protein IMPACT-like [Rhynchophorus ferrugineus]|uniref:protein IMPACT-like n=1 Tax=Rhynchophorus ferrugineus TaxID=354439 RepID=UPI003FCE0900
MDNQKLQEQELISLESIFGKDWYYDEIMKNYIIKISKEAELWVTLTPDYPLNGPPKYEFWAPHINKVQRNRIYTDFIDIYEKFKGEPIIFQWIERFKEVVHVPKGSGNVKAKGATKVARKYDSSDNVTVDIKHSDPINDRKSTFQGHACRISCMDDVEKFRNSLLANKKIAQAKHNVLAYRFKNQAKLIVQDYDNDGEKQAGSRLLHLLKILEADNAAVIVTRWYGGIQIGSDRFKHYNEAARLALLEANLSNKS